MPHSAWHWYIKSIPDGAVSAPWTARLAQRAGFRDRAHRFGDGSLPGEGDKVHEPGQTGADARVHIRVSGLLRAHPALVGASCSWEEHQRLD